MAITERWCGGALVLLSLGACAGADAASRGADPDTHRIAVRIDFEPALTEPGQLEVAHECGERLVVATSRAGVDLRLRPGPVALTLRVGGMRHDCALRVTPGLPPVVWRCVDGKPVAPPRPGNGPVVVRSCARSRAAAGALRHRSGSEA